MTNSKSTKRALLASSIALLLCFAMLLGTTFAWFTDSVATASNVITAGNLDVDVQYTLDGTTWNDLDGATDLFQKGLWEPGHTEVVVLKIENKGSLALKYNANMNIISETPGKNKAGEDIVLSDVLTTSTLTIEEAGVDPVLGMNIAAKTLEKAFEGESEIAWGASSSFKTGNVLESDKQLYSGKTHYVFVKVDMAETVGNEANHNGTDIPTINFGINVLATQYTYEDDSFGNQYDVDAEYFDGKIRGGIFEKNPAEIDPSLAEDNSEYIAINYEKDGKTYYVVSKRSETVIVTPAGTAYEPKNNNYSGNIMVVKSGELYKAFQSIVGNEHTTLYMLPGTYKEATTITVSSNVDIIGLGDKDSVKVVKGSSSSSNRHLFNCTNSGDEYIQVSLRNLYLDATEKTTNSKDNAAVQSIRRTKVKCYDLTIVKGTGWDAVAFYVNGNNTVNDGTKPTAYLYAENCVLNTSRTFGVVSTAGSYKFYYNNLKYNNGSDNYTTTNSSIHNKSMDDDAWEW